ncbi:41880_t:CDS:2 [Gigaspora margarita]|uniref:41880_t:CDS:1 n=1 Tax=Gigaspora margarita TaxID=4874 RepID=A0ABN7VXU1_GIGMA|nr:41880_t:CDS:2 [Gigaspora margarita]
MKSNNSSISSVYKGDRFEIKAFRLLKNKIKDDMRDKELEAHCGHRGCYKSQVIIACERPSLLCLLSEKLYLGLLSRGDGGIDMFGNHNYYLLLFQCKDLNNKVEVDYIRDFESVILRFDEQTTIRIYITSAKDGYSRGAVGRAKSSEYYLL